MPENNYSWIWWVFGLILSYLIGVMSNLSSPRLQDIWEKYSEKQKAKNEAEKKRIENFARLFISDPILYMNFQLLYVESKVSLYGTINLVWILFLGAVGLGILLMNDTRLKGVDSFKAFYELANHTSVGLEVIGISAVIVYLLFLSVEFGMARGSSSHLSKIRDEMMRGSLDKIKGIKPEDQTGKQPF